MTQPGSNNKKNTWTVKDSANLYGLDRWGESYFTINKSGNIDISPQGEEGCSLDLTHLLDELKGRNLKPPLLLRFDDILEDRLKRLHHAFEDAIKKYDYKSQYQGVIPKKCNKIIGNP